MELVTQFAPILVIVLLAVLIGIFVVIAGHALGPRRPTEVKGQPYESGMSPYGPGARRMSVRYYMVAVLFILFDIELVFFLPFAIVLKELKLYGLVEIIIFVAVLLVGYIYAWKKGALEWE